MNDDSKDQVWNKAVPISDCSNNEWRLDCYKNVIHYSEYGKITQYGWEIDHKIPKARGGSDDISNLFPVHWQANRAKSDKTPSEFLQSEFIKALRSMHEDNS